MQVLDIVWFAVNFSVLMYSKKSVTHPGNNLVRIFCGEGKVCKVAPEVHCTFFPALGRYVELRAPSR